MVLWSLKKTYKRFRCLWLQALGKLASEKHRRKLPQHTQLEQTFVRLPKVDGASNRVLPQRAKEDQRAFIGCLCSMLIDKNCNYWMMDLKANQNKRIMHKYTFINRLQQQAMILRSDEINLRAFSCVLFISIIWIVLMNYLYEYTFSYFFSFLLLSSFYFFLYFHVHVNVYLVIEDFFSSKLLTVCVLLQSSLECTYCPTGPSLLRWQDSGIWQGQMSTTAQLTATP